MGRRDALYLRRSGAHRGLSGTACQADRSKHQKNKQQQLQQQQQKEPDSWGQ